jgi:hypothetical protein
VIGDKDPEDAYDAGDPPKVRLEVLGRVLEDLRAAEFSDRREIRRLDALRLLRNLANDVDELLARAVELTIDFENL